MVGKTHDFYWGMENSERPFMFKNIQKSDFITLLKDYQQI